MCSKFYLLTVFVVIFLNCNPFAIGDCTVTLKSENPKMAYSFQCDYAEFQECAEIMTLDELDVKSGDSYNIGRCYLRTYYDRSKKCIVVLLRQYDGSRVWDEENPLRVYCKRRHWEDLKDYLNGRCSYDNINLSMVVVR